MEQPFFWQGTEPERPRVCRKCFERNQELGLQQRLVEMVINEHGYVYIVCPECGGRELITVSMP